MPVRRSPARGGETPEIIFRDFAGMNLESPREAIEDDEFYWLENVMPVARGNLVPIPVPSVAKVTIASEIGPPTYTKSFNANNVDYVFAVWSASGNGWVVNTQTWVATKIIIGSLVSGKTAAEQWADSGLLIVDPNGYWDWNVTVAATLTALANTLQSLTLTGNGRGYTAIPAVSLNSGSGYNVVARMGLASITISAAGSGYFPGDVLSINTVNSYTGYTPIAITVTTTGGGGAITGVSITAAGVVDSVVTGTISLTGGSGTGATATVNWMVTALLILAAGSGFNSVTPTVNFSGGTPNTAATATAITSFGFGGTAIASYANRVWIASGRTVVFTDVNSYFSFAGSGSSFTINDAYLHSSITFLIAANNYLYIGGVDSIDVLSNVTVSGGVASFSRLNINASIGTTLPNSLFVYYRGLVFANTSGFYVLSGATPENVSKKISQLISAIDFTQPVYGAEAVINNELCAALMFTFIDTFNPSFTNTSRVVLAVFFRSRWWMYSLSNLAGTLAGIVSIPVLGKQTLFGWVGNALYQLMSGGVNTWYFSSRLWDAGAPLLEKQAISAGVGVTLNSNAAQDLTLTVDTEFKSTAFILNTNIALATITWVNQASNIVMWINQSSNTVLWILSSLNYRFFTDSVQAGGSQYLGLSLSGGNNVNMIRLLALRGKQDRDMLT